ncbi:MAG: bleomycin resistance protein [Alphaproteobacteria bacterium]|nr:bleomycin resistance protein [Alphaproteobacteria bacterium]
MARFRVLGTNHTSFTVTSLDQTLAFFRDELGFRATEKMVRDPNMAENVTGVKGAQITVAFVDVPGHRLEFIEYASPGDRAKVIGRPCDAGFAHIAFDVDDIDAALASSRSHGFKPLGSIQVSDKGPNKGRKIVYTTNADGITIEFIQP